MLKDAVGYSKFKLPDFIKKMKEMVDMQQDRVVEAITGTGDYSLMGEFQQYFKGDTWWTMTVKQKHAHIKKMNKHLSGYSLPPSSM